MPWACLIAFAALFLTAGAGVTTAQQKKSAQLGSPDTRDVRRMEALKEQVRHQLVMLPYYSVFDWLQASVKPDGTVVLKGAVTRPTLKDDAEHRVKNIEAATRVTNNIEVLPLSTFDDELRIALYRALFRYNSPLFRYGTQSVPPIHIIVKNGRVTLKGVVLNQMDSQLAEMTARQVPGSFEVRNELQIEQREDQKVSRK
ncbi:MAG TPA: BON domain-containing protein [Verrucomicrobiae bacterium]|nr:BON domain-containing protein [Verrucomicrobiae bacterium]